MYVQELPWKVNYDESEVPLYTLPDVLTAVDGSKITTAAQWEANREALVQVFRDVMYGRRPPMADKVEYTLLSEKKGALDGTAVMRQIELKFTMNNGKSHKAVMLLFIPADAKGPVPVYCGLTFIGNHVVCDDPDILITGSVGAEFRSFDYTRGVQSRRFDLKTFMKRSIALAVCSYHDFFPDDYKGWKKSIWSLFVPEEEMEPRIKNASAIGAWAWGLSRMLDYLETVPEIDADKAAVFGHSRLGKTSLWAAVEDTRFKFAHVNDSGCGGAAPNRRLFGETLFCMCSNSSGFGHYWFSEYVNDVCLTPEKMPVDQHQLIALVAPRGVAVHSATEDLWADPTGEYISLWNANPVYALYGKNTLTSATPPPPDTPVGTDMSYFLRKGNHDLLPSDWACSLDAFEYVLKHL